MTFSDKAILGKMSTGICKQFTTTALFFREDVITHTHTHTLVCLEILNALWKCKGVLSAGPLHPLCLALAQRIAANSSISTFLSQNHVHLL